MWDQVGQLYATPTTAGQPRRYDCSLVAAFGGTALLTHTKTNANLETDSTCG
jgi:hypothetical protein